jgi:aspartate dehydrogenase
MKSADSKLKLGIVGCGAIGSRIARSVTKELKDGFRVVALYDIEPVKAQALATRLKARGVVAASVDDLIRRSDIVVEAVNTLATTAIVQKSLKAGKSILAMSIGRLLSMERGNGLFCLARRSRGHLLLPSGAIAGLDAIKAASLAGIRSITLTSTKPPSGFANNPYIKEKGIDLKGLSGEKVLFDGSVRDAVRYFPQNINVAAAIALAAGTTTKLRVRIAASSRVSCNTHEIVVEGACGRITTKTENAICPDNPKTSYLAVLSGIRTLQGFASRVRVGT